MIKVVSAKYKELHFCFCCFFFDQPCPNEVCDLLLVTIYIHVSNCSAISRMSHMSIHREIHLLIYESYETFKFNSQRLQWFDVSFPFPLPVSNKIYLKLFETECKR